MAPNIALRTVKNTLAAVGVQATCAQPSSTRRHTPRQLARKRLRSTLEAEFYKPG